MSSSPLTLLVSLAGVGIYGYSFYFMVTDTKIKGMQSLMPEKLVAWGHIKFLTFQCLVIQLLSSLLHVAAHFVRPLRKPRDLLFTTLAYPVGSVVVYSFWAVWHLMGRELIFPAVLSQYYPDWLNHSTHTLVVPINLLLAFFARHHYSKSGQSITMLYFAAYVSLLYYIKWDTGHFVYKYLDTMNDLERAIYFPATALFAYIMYKSGQLLTNVIHQQGSQRPQVPKKPKQK